jgi:hypothetical protein
VKTIPTLDEVMAYQSATDFIKDMEASVRAHGYAPFSSKETSLGFVSFRKNRLGKPRMYLGDTPAGDLAGPVRVELVASLRLEGAQ